MSLTITSPSFEMNGKIPSLYTCDSENISPELNFTNVPPHTKSLALIMEDPDVPKDRRLDGMWNHWVVYNMSPFTTKIDEGKTPPGLIGVNSGGKMTYGGPCPPDREHRYFFFLYALDTVLDLEEGATKDELLQALNSHVIEKAELIGLYNRTK